MTRKKWSRLSLLATLLLSTTFLIACGKPATRVVILATDDVVFNCPRDTINGRVYVCDSSVDGITPKALLYLYEQLRDCQARDEALKKK